ncbi:citramalate synthase [Elioraea thermophila]|uniref:citramalate synthase n=1 Tax=Elioraea thermophila TaxID=2185104 RepID=UPI000DF21401|nr:citramalate synthase [Elioraea thermophila]
MTTRIHLYDCTLRDGQQMQGVDWGVADKIAIARALDAFGIDTIEGGWPGANPIDDAFFASPPPLRHARLAAFGMTRRAGRSAANDPGLAAVFAARTPIITLVGKTWDYHAEVALGVTLEENLAMIAESVAEAKRRATTVMFDAEHFFDGFKRNRDYALAAIRAAHEAGAEWIVLCDTNGGTLPHEVEEIVREVTRLIPGERLGFHGHDDTGNGVANSLAAVRAGCRMVQGTINGIGERCGNANLVSIIPTLMLKMGYTTGVSEEQLRGLTKLSRLIDERLNRAPARGAPYVGESAFAHKGGLHVSAVARDPATYEHIAPERVGNHRVIVVSDQAGRSNILARLREAGIEIDPEDARVKRILDEVKAREFAGYAYDGAEASFELLARRVLGTVPEYFRLESFRTLVERRHESEEPLSEATLKLIVKGERVLTVAEGNGPVNALDAALRKALEPHYPEVRALRLVDYKVRILTPDQATAATTRVMIESEGPDQARWSTVGVSGNVIEASFGALADAVTYLLLREGVAA